MPWLVNAPAMRDAARLSFEQVKQCAKIAWARGVPDGDSSRAASCTPSAPGNLIEIWDSLMGAVNGVIGEQCSRVGARCGQFCRPALMIDLL